MSTTTAESLRLAWILHEAMKQLATLMIEADQKLADSRKNGTPPRTRAIAEAFHRAQAWAATFSRLTEPADVQARGAGTRTLFEIAVDMALLHIGTDDDAQ